MHSFFSKSHPLSAVASVRANWKEPFGTCSQYICLSQFGELQILRQALSVKMFQEGGNK